MTDSNVITLNKPEQKDPLQEVLREGARKMLTAAIEAEIAIFIEQHMPPCAPHKSKQQRQR